MRALSGGVWIVLATWIAGSALDCRSSAGVSAKPGDLVDADASVAVRARGHRGTFPPESRRAEAARARMVRYQIEARGIADARVIAAMRAGPRHELVPPEVRDEAYEDTPLPIGYGQTISQPYIVAKMTELLALSPGDRVLEIGTGSGYQAAVLAELGAEVYTIEIVAPLSERARGDLARLGYHDVHVRSGDGYQGWPEAAPFRGIVVTAAAPTVPEPLLAQLSVGARLVIPVGRSFQELRVITRTDRGFTDRSVFPVRFVPMTGRAIGE